VFTINGQPIEEVQEFVYLGSLLDFRATVAAPDKADIDRRIAKARARFYDLRKRTWKSHRLPLPLKANLFKLFILPVLFHGAATWTVLPDTEIKIEGFICRCLRSLLKVRWQQGQHRATNAEVLRQAGIPSVERILRAERLRWFGHVMRMQAYPEDRWPHRILGGAPVLAQGQNNLHHKMRWVDLVEKDLRIMGRLTSDEHLKPWIRADCDSKAKWREMVRLAKALDGPSREQPAPMDQPPQQQQEQQQQQQHQQQQQQQPQWHPRWPEHRVRTREEINRMRTTPLHEREPEWRPGSGPKRGMNPWTTAFWEWVDNYEQQGIERERAKTMACHSVGLTWAEGRELFRVRPPRRGRRLFPR
jgi:hypothetical protein